MFVRFSIVVAGLVASSAIAQVTSPASGNANVLQQFYPQRALAAREEGAVGFKVTLDSRGDVTACQVTKTSGHPLLDEETCNILTLHASFKPDVDVTGSRVASHEGTIVWKLPDSTTNFIGAPKTLAAGTAPDKVICRKVATTGSLVSAERTCMTTREWAKQSAAAKEMWEDVQGKKGSTSGN